jgi:serine protease Do
MKAAIRAVLAAALLASPAAAQDAADLQRRRSPVVEVFQQCRDAVVNISTARVVRVRSLGARDVFDDIFDFRRPTTTQRRVTSVGSGVVIHRDGYVVTNAHVVAQTSDIVVTFANGTAAAAQVVAADPAHDLAVLRVQTREPLSAITLGQSDDLMVGETVVAIGNPLGLGHSVTTGIVSALGRELRYSDSLVYSDLIQTDAAINPGNSGGPLLNVLGRMIGITTAIRGDAQNVGFAIPVDRLWELLPNLLDIEKRQRVRLGLRVVGKEARVETVRGGSPAAAAGLRPGDRLLRLEDQPLADAIDFYVRLAERRPGQRLKLGVERGGKPVNVEIALQEVPIPDGSALAARLFGIRLSELPADLRRRYELPDYINILVDSVQPNSPADRAGIREGDVILRLNRIAVTTLEEVGLSLEGVQPADDVLVDGLRWRADPAFVWSVPLRARR